MTWVESSGGVASTLNRYDRYYSGGTERDRFVTAFKVLIERGEFPSPGALNREQGFHTRRAIPGRLTGLRQVMLAEAGYHFDETKRRWVKIEPRDLGCPVCYAPPGDACTTPSGKPPKPEPEHVHSFPLSTGVCGCGEKHPLLGPPRDDDWTPYHEFRKATDPPPWGEGRTEYPATFQEALDTIDGAELRVAAHYAEIDGEYTFRLAGSLPIKSLSREEFDLLWYGRKIRRWRRAWWWVKDNWISRLRSITLRP